MSIYTHAVNLNENRAEVTVTEHGTKGTHYRGFSGLHTGFSGDPGFGGDLCL